MTLFIYIIQSLLISALLCCYYMLFLRNRFFHAFNRIFLIGIPVLALIIPLLHINLPAIWNRNMAGTPIRLLAVGRGNLEEAFTIYSNQRKNQKLTREFVFAMASVLVSLVLFFRLFRSVRFLQTLKKKSRRLSLSEGTIYFVGEKEAPFSFFRSIFWREDIELKSETGRQILRHELFHVKQLHSFDIFLLEILSAVFWFNPFFRLTARELKAIHEYGADQYAAGLTDKFSYAELLLTRVSGHAISFTHPFFKNQIKRRIHMITKNQSKAGWLGRLMILPLLLVIAGIFSFRYHPVSPKKTIRVVVDAGHGGIFTGAEYQQVKEKDINLSIAKKIQALSGSYNVEVIMSREKDESPGSNDLSKSLAFVASLAEQNNADLFISIHTNSALSPNTDSGFDIYIPGNTNRVFNGSMLLGTTIAGQIKSDYSVRSELKQRDQGVWVLDKASVPAVLIECGFIDNAADLKFIMNEENQEKIARDILEGVRQYADHPAVSNVIPEKGSDSMSYEAMENLDKKQIASLEMNVKENYIIVHLTNGKNAFVKITDEIKKQMIAGNTNNVDTAVFSKVEVEAEYPGGQQGWYSYLSKHLSYPPAAVKKEIQGTVIVEFIVKSDGSLSDVKAISGPTELRDESVRALKESGKWIPAKNNGTIVDSYRKQPFNFKLTQS